MAEEAINKKKKTLIHRGEYHLTEDQIQTLIRLTEKLRDKVIIELLAYCGLRRFEVAKIKIEDINFTTNQIHIIGKGSIERTAIIFIDKLTEDLKLYITYVLDNKKQGFLFPAVSKLNQEDHIALERINSIVAKAGNRAHLINPTPNLKNINPHILRHSCARILKDKGFPMEVVQKVLGHTDYTITANIYGTLSTDQLQKELKEKAGNLFT